MESVESGSSPSLGIYTQLLVLPLSGPFATAPEAGIGLVVMAGKSEATRRNSG